MHGELSGSSARVADANLVRDGSRMVERVPDAAVPVDRLRRALDEGSAPLRLERPELDEEVDEQPLVAVPVVGLLRGDVDPRGEVLAESAREDVIGRQRAAGADRELQQLARR